LSDPTPIPGQTGPLWTAGDTLFFYGGWLSNFAPTPGLRLPYGYAGHSERDKVPVQSAEHWFQACKARTRRGFDNVLACGSPGGAKRAGRQLELRPRLGAGEVRGHAVRFVPSMAPADLGPCLGLESAPA
jgi:predicted NAD-dependent protein-ADP-ribosyltransferase YbiA (DUF1768 family)